MFLRQRKRPIEEVVESQRRMIRNRGTQGGWQFQVLIVDYPGLVRDPGPWLVRISAFLDGKVDPDAMAAVIRPELHRNRAG